MGAQTDAFNAPYEPESDKGKLIARRLTTVLTEIRVEMAAKKAARAATELADVESERAA